MYPTSQSYKHRIVGDVPQDLLVVFNDRYFSAMEGDFEVGGAVLDEYANTGEDVMIGETPSSSFRMSVMNQFGYLDGYKFGEGKPYIGVYLNDFTYTRPAGATAYSEWDDSDSVTHIIYGTSSGLYIDGTKVDNKAVVSIWSIDDRVAVTTATTIDEWHYSNSEWTKSEKPLSDFMANRTLHSAKFQHNFLNVFADDGNGTLWEYCPLGVFIFEAPAKTRTPVINVTAFDRMTLFDKDAAEFLSQPFVFPMTVFDIYTSLCVFCGVYEYADHSAFINSDLSLVALPAFEAGITCRGILSYIAEAAGSIAQFDRDGKLQIRVCYTDISSVNIGEDRIALNNFEQAEYDVPRVNGLLIKDANGEIRNPMFTTGNELYTILANSLLAGTDDINRWRATASTFIILSSYTPTVATVISADPSYTAGETVKLLGKRIPIMYQSLTWNNRASAVYSATGKPHREIPSSFDRTGFAIASNSSDIRSVKTLLQYTNEGLTEIVNSTIPDINNTIQSNQELFSQYVAGSADALDTAANIKGYIRHGIVGWTSNNQPIMGIAIGQIETVIEHGEEAISRKNVNVITAEGSTIFADGQEVAKFTTDGTKISGELEMADAWRWFLESDGVHPNGILTLKWIGD